MGRLGVPPRGRPNLLSYDEIVRPPSYNIPMNKSRRSNGHQRRVLELRRSSASAPHKNKAKYNRKTKHKEYYV